MHNLQNTHAHAHARTHARTQTHPHAHTLTYLHIPMVYKKVWSMNDTFKKVKVRSYVAQYPVLGTVQSPYTSPRQTCSFTLHPGRPVPLHFTPGRPVPLHFTPGRPVPLHFTPADLFLYTSPPADLFLYTSPPADLFFYTSPPAHLFISTAHRLLSHTAIIPRRLFVHISTSVCIQVLFYTAEWTRATWGE